jgi:hypothetical protein
VDQIDQKSEKENKGASDQSDQTINDQRSTINARLKHGPEVRLYPVRLYVDLTFIFCSEITGFVFRPSFGSCGSPISSNASDDPRSGGNKAGGGDGCRYLNLKPQTRRGEKPLASRPLLSVLDTRRGYDRRNGIP